MALSEQNNYHTTALEGSARTCDVDFPPLGPSSRQQSISLADPTSSRVSTPPVPPGFEHVDPATVESRRGTPTVPPGLSKPTGLPDLEGTGSRPSSRASIKRTTSGVTPVLPLRPATPARPKTPTDKDTKEVEKDKVVVKELVETPLKTPAAAVGGKSEADAVAPAKTAPKGTKKAEVEAKKENNVPTSTGPAVQAPVPIATPKKPANHQTVEVPSKPIASPVESKPVTTSSQATARTTQPSKPKDEQTAPATPTKTDTSKAEASKRKHPGKLDITAAVGARDPAAVPSLPDKTSLATNTPKKTEPASSSQTPAVASLPASPSVSSPAVRSTAPKTLRVVQTPKAEEIPAPTLPTQPSISTPSAVPAAFKLPSRQPSLASMNPPETPSSEHISDNISMTSTSMSRANSPPPAGGKVGSAPVRAKTKNQMKKDRQDRAKAIEEERVRMAEEEKEKNKIDEAAQQQEAIVSRKKKTKKEKAPVVKPKARDSVGTADTTPTASRPASPGFKPSPVVQAVKEEVIQKPTTPPKPPTIAPPVQPPAVERPFSPPPPDQTAKAILEELQRIDPSISKSLEALLRTPTQTPNSKHPHPITAADITSTISPAFWNADFKVHLSKTDIDALLKEALPALRYQHGGGNKASWGRGMVSPSGAHLKALGEELETRFLELEKEMRAMPRDLRFKSEKPGQELQFPALDLEVMKRAFLDRPDVQGRRGAWGKSGGESGRGVSVMEQMVQDGGSKKGAFLVDEAQKYVNEYVMPPAAASAVQPGVAVGGGQVEAGAQEEILKNGVAVGRAGLGERQIQDAKRVGDEKENALRKMIKKNKKLLGLG